MNFQEEFKVCPAIDSSFNAVKSVNPFYIRSTHKVNTQEYKNDTYRFYRVYGRVEWYAKYPVEYSGKNASKKWLQVDVTADCGR